MAENLNGTDARVLINTGLVEPYDIEIDDIGNKIYWTDLLAGKIQQSNLDGTDVKDIVTGLDHPGGLALDLVNNKIFWTINSNRGEGGKIQKSNIDGTDIQDVILEGTPERIDLDVNNNHLYWTDYGSNTIRRANTNGDVIQDILIDSNGVEAIALDLTNRKIYWISPYGGTVALGQVLGRL